MGDGEDVCRRGGNIIDFAGHLYGLDPARSYRELLDRLTSELLSRTDLADQEPAPLTPRRS